MAHECLFMSDRDGPSLQTSGTTQLGAIPTSWQLLLPANSLYLGKTLRIRASGMVSAVHGVGLSIRLNLSIGALGAIVPMWAVGTIYTSTRSTIPVVWYLDWTITCRAVAAALTTFHLTTMLVSPVLIGALDSNSPVITAVCVTPPAVSSLAINNNINNYLNLLVSGAASSSYAFQVQNYRVDKIA